MKGRQVYENIVKKMEQLFPDGVEILNGDDGFYTVKPKGLDESHKDFYTEHESKYEELWTGLFKFGFHPTFPDGMKWNGKSDFWCFLTAKFNDGIVIQLLGDFVLMIDLNEQKKGDK